MIGTIAGAIIAALSIGGTAWLQNIFRTGPELESKEKIEQWQLDLQSEQLSWEKMAFFLTLIKDSDQKNGASTAMLLAIMMGAFGSSATSGGSGASDGNKNNIQNTSNSNSTINQPVDVNAGALQGFYNWNNETINNGQWVKTNTSMTGSRWTYYGAIPGYSPTYDIMGNIIPDISPQSYGFSKVDQAVNSQSGIYYKQSYVPMSVTSSNVIQGSQVQETNLSYGFSKKQIISGQS